MSNSNLIMVQYTQALSYNTRHASTAEISIKRMILHITTKLMTSGGSDYSIDAIRIAYIVSTKEVELSVLRTKHVKW